MSFAFNPDLRARVKRRLQAFDVAQTGRAGLRPAAVAILLVNDPETNDACFVLTRRPRGLNRHGGQYALPGGRLDPGEDNVAAALREVNEEIGVVLTQEAVIGELDVFPTRSGFCIKPVVLWGGRDPVFDIDPGEVAALYTIPLWDLARPEIPHLDHTPDGGQPVLSAPFETLGRRVYAPTAAILYQFREVALYGRATRVDHYEQPRFAWR